MQIYVCVKHVPDTAAKITVVDGREFAETCKFIVNPYDEYAVEEAVQIRDSVGGGEVVIVTVGKESALNTMRSALAIGADRGILVKTDAQFVDSGLTGQALKAAIEADGAADLVICGKQSIDSEGMQTPFRLAKAMDVGVVTDVVGLSVGDGKAVAEREIGGGAREVVELGLPCVIGATRGLNEPRYPKLPDIMKARKKPIRTITLDGLGLDSPAGSMEIVELRPAVEKRRGQIIEGPFEKAVPELVRLLREEAKVI